MRVNLRQSFIHPVLRPESDDFLPDQQFELEIRDPRPSLNGTEIMAIDFKLTLTAEDLLSVVSKNQAVLYLDFRCSETLFQKTVEINIESSVALIEGVVELDQSQIYGKLSIIAAVVTREQMNDYSPTKIHPEFGTKTYSLGKGVVLAVSPRIDVPIGFDMRPRNSMVRMERSEDISENSYQISPDNVQITAFLGNRMFELYQNARVNPSMKSYLYLGIFKDCLVVALEKLADSSEFEYPWMRTLSEKLNSLQINLSPDLTFIEINDIALQLLGKYGVEKILEEIND